MTAVRHDGFTVRIDVDAAPDLVLAAFAEPQRRRRWLRMPGSAAQYEEDFRIGGVDTARSTFPLPGGAQRLLNTAVHLDIADRRLVWAYTAAVDDVVRWAALVTVELEAAGTGTAVTWTEQVALLVASERPEDDLKHLRGAVRLRLNGLAAATEG